MKISLIADLIITIAISAIVIVAGVAVLAFVAGRAFGILT